MDPFKMYCVELSGCPRERGRQHGEELRSQIQAIFEFGRQGLEQARGPSLETIGAAFSQSTGHLQAARRWTPDLIEELEGLAEAAEVDFGVLWAFQCQDESYWFSTGQIGSFQRRPEVERCSSLGIAKTEGRPTLLAQNLDTPSLYNGFQTLLHIHYPDSDREAYIVSEPGLVGICGLNSSPVGVCQNTLALKLHYDPDGLPAMLVARGLIDQPDLDSARNFLFTVRHASGINYMVADAETIEDYECSANQIRRFVPSGESNRIAHTNHPLSNTDRIDPEGLSEEFRQLYSLSNEHSAHRLGCLDRLFYKADEPVNIETIKRVLSSHEPEEFPVCRHKQPESDPMRGMTNNSLIMNLSELAELQITSGPPCTYEYKTFKFEKGR